MKFNFNNFNFLFVLKSIKENLGQKNKDKVKVNTVKDVQYLDVVNSRPFLKVYKNLGCIEGIKPVEILLYSYFLDKINMAVDDREAPINVDNDEIRAFTGLDSSRTIKKYLDSLEKLGLIEIKKSESGRYKYIYCLYDPSYGISKEEAIGFLEYGRDNVVGISDKIVNYLGSVFDFDAEEVYKEKKKRLNKKEEGKDEYNERFYDNGATDNNRSDYNGQSKMIDCNGQSAIDYNGQSKMKKGKKSETGNDKRAYGLDDGEFEF